ncbi:MAG TPA: response regulator [Opitutaceae bacterium]
MTPLRILIADDSLEFLAACHRFLNSLPGVRIVAAATDGYLALHNCEQTQPDLVLLDAFMDGLDGFQTAHRLKAQRHPPVIVMTSLHDFETYRVIAQASGADAYVPKSELFVRLPLLFASLVPPRPPASSERRELACTAAR